MNCRIKIKIKTTKLNSMSSKNLLIAFTVSAFAIGFSSCKKTTTTTDTATNASSTTELSQDLAISDNITEDANNSVMVAADNQSLIGARPAGVESPDSVSICAAVSANIHAFPDTINVNFSGTSCNGVTRSGSISIVLSGYLRANGTVATVTFNNYFVNGYNRQGTIVWTNTRSSTGDTLSWTRVDNGKVVAPSGGKYWTCSGTRKVKQIAGIGTYTMWDDAFSLTGNLTVTNQNNLSASAVTVTPLQKAVSCPFIGQGQLQLTGPGGNALLIDYGNGTCDANATYSLNGGPALQFSLL